MSTLCWHLLFAQPGTAARDAITQFNYHVEFNGVTTQQTVVGSTTTRTVMVQSADCNIPDWRYSWAAELYGPQGVFIFSKTFFFKTWSASFAARPAWRGHKRFHLRCHGWGRKTSKLQRYIEIKQWYAEWSNTGTNKKWKWYGQSLLEIGSCVNVRLLYLWLANYHFKCSTRINPSLMRQEHILKTNSATAEGADICSWGHPVC